LSATKSSCFCVLPWYSQEIEQKKTTHCCLLPNGYDLEKLQADLLAGRRSPYCQKCWEIEDRGEDSRRIQENRFLDFKLDRSIDLIEQDCRDGESQPLMYQIYLSNLCNQACVTCDTSASTKWAGLLARNEKKTIEIFQTSLSTSTIDYATARRFYILGGEPLFDPALSTLLNKLIEHDNTDCFISFVTNGSVNPRPYLRNLLQRFTDLNICVSIDGVGKRFEYMRWPGQWASLLENIRQYQEISRGNLSISYTISSVNALYYDETVNWFNQQNLRYNHNIVYYPAWANLFNMPVEIKKALEKHKFFRPWTQKNGKETQLSTLARELQRQDELKKISLKDHMPELWNIINDATI